MMKQAIFYALMFGMIFGPGTGLAAGYTQARVQGRPPVRQVIYTRAKAGDVRALKALQARGISLEARDDKGNTALCEATWRKDRVAFQALRSAGANLGAACMNRIPASYKMAMGLSPATGTGAGTTGAGLAAATTAETAGLSTAAMVGIGVGAVALVGGGVALAAGGGGGGSHSAPACSGHGTKNADGVCQCNTGYDGENCSQCDSGYVNQNGVCYAEKACVNGTQVKDTCKCNDGWSGDLCSVADSCDGYKASCSAGYDSTTTCKHGDDTWYSCDKCDSTHIMFEGQCYDKIDCKHGGSQTGPTTCTCVEPWNGATCETCTGIEQAGECYENKNCDTSKHLHQEANECVCDTGYPHEYNGQCYAAISGGCGTNKHQQGDTCVCDSGYTPSGETCILDQCPANQYKNGNVCMTCPANSSSPAGSTSIVQCICESGYEKSSTGICIKKNTGTGAYVFITPKDIVLCKYNGEWYTGEEIEELYNNGIISIAEVMEILTHPESTNTRTNDHVQTSDLTQRQSEAVIGAAIWVNSCDNNGTCPTNKEDYSVNNKATITLIYDEALSTSLTGIKALADNNAKATVVNDGAIKAERSTDSDVSIYGIYLDKSGTIINNGIIDMGTTAKAFGSDSAIGIATGEYADDKSATIYNSATGKIIANNHPDEAKNRENINSVNSLEGAVNTELLREAMAIDTLYGNVLNDGEIIGVVRAVDVGNNNLIDADIIKTSGTLENNGTLKVSTAELYALKNQGTITGTSRSIGGRAYITTENYAINNSLLQNTFLRSKGSILNTGTIEYNRSDDTVFGAALLSAPHIENYGTINVKSSGRISALGSGNNSNIDITNYANITMGNNNEIGVLYGITVEAKSTTTNNKIKNYANITIGDETGNLSGSRGIGIYSEYADIENTGNLDIWYNGIGIYKVGTGTVQNTGTINVRGPSFSNSEVTGISGGGTIKNYGDITSTLFGITGGGKDGNIYNEGNIVINVINGNGRGISGSGESLAHTYPGTITNKGDIIINGNGRGISYTSYGTITNKGDIIINGDGLGISSGIESTIDNSGDIIITGDGTGITADGGTVTNTGNITINGSGDGIVAYEKPTIDNSGDIIITGTGRGITADGGTVINTGNITINGVGYGIYSHRKATIDNSGDITIGSVDGYGIYSKGGTVTNTGNITLGEWSKSGSEAMYCALNKCYYFDGENDLTASGSDGEGYYKNRSGDGTKISPYIYSNYYSYTDHFIVLLNGATLSMAGTINTNDKPLNLTTMSPDNTGKIVLQPNAVLASQKSVSGNAYVSNAFLTNNFANEVVAENMIQTPDASGLNLISQSALFDAKLAENGTDVIMTKKSFATLTGNGSLASFLEKNYTAGRNEGFFNTLKSLGTVSEFNGALRSMTGLDNLTRFAHEDLTALRDMNLTMNAAMFANDDKPLFQTQGSLTAFSFKNDRASGGQYALANRRISPSVKVGYALSMTRLNTGKDTTDTRNSTVFQVATPVSLTHGRIRAIMTPTIGFARGHYNRSGFNGTTYKGTLEKRFAGVMNEARVPMTVAGWEVSPTMELNAVAYNQRGNEEDKAFSLTIPSDNRMSVEGGMGLHVARTYTWGRQARLNLMAGIMGYREFANPYNIKMGMSGMDGTFDLYDDRVSAYRGVANLGLDFTAGEWQVFGSLRHYMERETHTDMTAGLKYRF